MTTQQATTDNLWQFWIDVGGTFTDCVAIDPVGNQHVSKVLSSGRTKGTAEFQNKQTFFDAQRATDPDGFWNDYQVQFLNEKGVELAQRTVLSFAKGKFTFDSGLDDVFSSGSQQISYELSSDDIAPIIAIRRQLGLPRNDSIPKCKVRLGTTRGTNALITRQGVRVAFVTTFGFKDALHIGYQDRPKLFALDIQKREPLFEVACEINERLSNDGKVLQGVDDAEVREKLKELYDQGIESLAICFLHGYRFPQHEQLVAEIAGEIGFQHVVCSSDVSQTIKFVIRAETTVLDAYLNPVLSEYLRSLREKLGDGSELRLIDSAGGLRTGDFTGKDSVLSGPAGGVVGFSKTALAAGFENSIGFDMGGTSTDVSRFGGRYQYESESIKADVRIAIPVLNINTVAAGGGSICSFDGTRFLVGPQSAGSDPGPACYGRGGPLTVTDLNLFLGRLVPDQFPFELNKSAVKECLESISHQVRTATKKQLSLKEIAEGFLRIANEKMAAAIRTISVSQGFNPADHTLVAFGGAAAQHVCAVAKELEIPRILIHPNASILSAFGIGLSEVRRHKVVGVYRLLSKFSESELQAVQGSLNQSLLQQFELNDPAKDAVEIENRIALRYSGTENEIKLPIDCDFHAEFSQRHQEQYGYSQDRELEVVSLHAVGTLPTEIKLPKAERLQSQQRYKEQDSTHENDEAFDLVDRATIQAGDMIAGKSLIYDSLSTIALDKGWMATCLSDGQLLLEQLGQEESGKGAHSGELPAESDPTLLEVFNSRFAAIATQMGETLKKTSVSVNVKERLDFSCAIFDRSGQLVVNAPHIPVHLGAMSETVKSIIADNKTIRRGDIFVTNDPYRGGSHLPDVTVITPVHLEESAEDRTAFFVASRAHHAEIGGVTPGSMPPFSKNLSEEGVLISNFKLFDAGHPKFDSLETLLKSGAFPSRSPAENLADIRAQVASNHQGVIFLLEMIKSFGWETVSAYMSFIQNAAETKTRAAISKLPDGEHHFEDRMDSGATIRTRICVTGDTIEFDFSGTDATVEDNFNANRGIVMAAIIYCLRCLIEEDIPLNEGLLKPVQLTLPECFLNPTAGESPSESAAMVAGNVETSQRVVDLIFGALGVCAASQGTMNNLLFGNEKFGYYETICGGAGATQNENGADAVHTHMTNTRMTDPEVFEQHFPVRLLKFSIREDEPAESVDEAHIGGKGIERVIQFLEPLDVALLTSRRNENCPFGLDRNGELSSKLAGKSGENAICHNAEIRFYCQQELNQLSFESLDSKAQIKVAEGTILRIKTPCGGSYETTRE